MVKKFAEAFGVPLARLDQMRSTVSKQQWETKKRMAKASRPIASPGPGSLERLRSSEVLLAGTTDFYAVLQTLCHR